MRVALFILLAAVPILEIWLLVKLGQSVGIWAVIALVLGTAVIGTYVLHRQGFMVMQRAMAAMAAGRPPVGAVVDGAFLLTAGFLLIAPGLLTDSLGLLLLVPQIRHALAAVSVRTFLRSATFRTSTFRTSAGPADDARGPWPQETRAAGTAEGSRPSGPAQGPVIDGEFERLDERTINPRRRPPDEPVQPGDGR